MARELKKNRTTPASKAKVQYPSYFGSHASMVNEEATKALEDQTKVVLADEHGQYTTSRDRLDNGLADPNRYPTARLAAMLRGSSEANTGK